MKKTLNDLTKDEWNTWFPIELVDHDPEWKNIYKKEKKRILEKIDSESVLRMEHFGSTSIPGIKSKPYIDMMIEIPDKLLFNENLLSKFSELGYTHFIVPGRGDIETYSSFGKGYQPDGTQKQVFHIHMCPKDNAMWKQIDFRDYLITNEGQAKKYEKLKLGLASKHKNDRGAYVLGKTQFINDTLKLIESRQVK